MIATRIGWQRVLTLLLVVLAVTAVVVTGTPLLFGPSGDYFVSPSGSDANPGSEGAPFRTIQKAADIVQPGDTVLVLEGVYDERVIVTRSGDLAARIEFGSYQTDRVTVTRGFELRGSHYVTLRGFKVTAAPSSGGFLIYGGSHNEIRDCEVTGSGAGFINKPTETTDAARNVFVRVRATGLPQAALVLGRYHLSSWPPDKVFQSTGVVVRDSEFAYSASAGGQNAYISGSHLLIENNEFHHNGLPDSQDVIHGDFEGSTFRGNHIHDVLKTPFHNDLFQAVRSVRNVFEGNTFHGASSIDFQGLFLMAFDGDIRENRIENNVFYDAGSSALKLKGGGRYAIIGNRISNNVFYSSSVTLKGSDFSEGPPINTVVSNNVFYQGTVWYEYGASPRDQSSDYNIYYGDSPAAEGVHSRGRTDPRFISIPARDFRLSANSPAIDAGTSEGAPATDKDGNNRFDDPETTNTGGGSIQYYDIGAYEFGATSGTPPPPDTTPPATTLTASPSTPEGESGWYKAVPSVTLAPDESATVRVQWDSTSTGGWTEDTGTLTPPEGSHTLYYFSTDSAGNAEDVKSRLFKLDTGSPTNPSVASSTHTLDAWSNSGSAHVSMSGASDAASGVDGYSADWSEASGTVPDAAVDLAGSTASTTSPVLADGSWYFHLRTKDVAGNWSTAVHVGPYRIDTVQPNTPAGSSSTHPQPEQFYADNHPRFSWSATDSPSGVDVYSTVLDRSTGTVPPASDGDAATSTDYPDTEDGTWYLHVRAKDTAGNWGSAGHIKINIDTGAPLPPTGLPALPGDGSVSLSWLNPMADFAGVRILRSTNGYAEGASASASQTAVYEGAAQNHLDPGLINGTTYYYSVFARDAAGNWSMPATVSAVPAVPPATRATAISLVASRGVVVYGRSVLLSGTLTQRSPAVPIQPVAATISVQRRLVGQASWTTVASGIRTSASGAWGVFVKPAYTASYRAVWPGEGVYAPATSSAVNVKVTSANSATAYASVVVRGDVVAVKGALGPAKRLKSVVVYARVGRVWRRIASTRTNTYSRYVWRFRPSSRGTRYFRTYFAGDIRNTASYSRILAVRVR